MIFDIMKIQIFVNVSTMKYELNTMEILTRAKV